MFVGIALYIVLFIAQWKMVEKAGYPGISQLIPIWNVVVLFKMAGYPGWAVLLMLVPVVNIVFGILVFVKISKAFGRSDGFAVLYIFLPPIAALILGFGDDQYDASLILKEI